MQIRGDVQAQSTFLTGAKINWCENKLVLLLELKCQEFAILELTSNNGVRERLSFRVSF